MDKGTAFISWLAGGTGIVLLYSAYKNVGPVSVLKGTLTGESTRTPISNGIRVGSTVSDVVDSATASSGGNNPRAVKLLARQTTPTLVPIPSQPNMRLDVAAMGSFMVVQAAYGKPIPLTGAWRSEQVQADGYERDPSRYAAPGKGGHPVGIAIDIDSNKVDLSDPKLLETFERFGWFRRGRSGIMHYSWGVPA